MLGTSGITPDFQTVDSFPVAWFTHSVSNKIKHIIYFLRVRVCTAGEIRNARASLGLRLLCARVSIMHARRMLVVVRRSGSRPAPAMRELPLSEGSEPLRVKPVSPYLIWYRKVEDRPEKIRVEGVTSVMAVRKSASPGSVRTVVDYPTTAPFLRGPFTAFQGWEDIDHSVCHNFKTGLVEGERRSVGIQTPDLTPWARS